MRKITVFILLLPILTAGTSFCMQSEYVKELCEEAGSNKAIVIDSEKCERAKSIVQKYRVEFTNHHLSPSEWTKNDGKIPYETVKKYLCDMDVTLLNEEIEEDIFGPINKLNKNIVLVTIVSESGKVIFEKVVNGKKTSYKISFS
jgi:hypothetical protein